MCSKKAGKTSLFLAFMFPMSVHQKVSGKLSIRHLKELLKPRIITSSPPLFFNSKEYQHPPTIKDKITRAIASKKGHILINLNRRQGDSLIPTPPFA